MHPSQTDPSDLTDNEWHILEALIPKPKPGGRPIQHTRRMIRNAIFYRNRTGCQWSMLPKDFPPKSAVFDYFSAWRKSGLWVELNHRWRVKVRVADVRKPSPTAAILDRQSVKGAGQGGEAIGDDAGKRVGGRKRHLLTDTLGLLLGGGVTSASVQDRDGAAALLASLSLLFGRRQVIWADGGDAGALVAWVKALRPFGKLHLDIVRRRADAKGFQLVRQRWIDSASPHPAGCSASSLSRGARLSGAPSVGSTSPAAYPATMRNVSITPSPPFSFVCADSCSSD